MTGTRRPAPWPHYAQWALEDVTAFLLEIEKMARSAQDGLRAERVVDVALLLGDIRNRAMDARETLRKAKDGER